MNSAVPFRDDSNVEAVSDATQLAALSFASAVHGYLSTKSTGTRVVLHRTMSRGGSTYLQQASPYASMDKLDHSRAGRVMDLDRGVVGYALSNKKVARTRAFASDDALHTAIQDAMNKVGDRRKFDSVARSYLAIPMLGHDGAVATLLYADSMTPGLFVPLSIVENITDMCRGFCWAIDQLCDSPFAYIENFPVQRGVEVRGKVDVYDNVQELLPHVDIPTYHVLNSFNVEAKRY